MPKKIVSDMIVSKKSIRAIPISPEKKAPVRVSVPKTISNRKPVNPKFVIWIIALIALMALFFGVSLLFSSVTLSITPKTEQVTFNNETYTAKLNSADTSALSFEVLSLNETDSMAVEANEEKIANQKASGKIVVYNNYSSAAQRLINNTRFESSTGKIYRIASSVDVPGTKVVAGKTVPGSVEVTVFADEPGDAYNLKLADMKGDFKIPGFKGSPRYDSFYARLKTDIAGGLIGKQKIVSESARNTATEAIKASLKESLLKELYAIKPDNYLIFPNAYSVEYVALADSFDNSSNKVTINIQGNLNSLVFNSLKLADYVAMKKIPSFDRLAVNFIPSDSLTVAFSSKDLSTLWQSKVVDVKLNGEGEIKWVYDTMAMKRDVAGRSASDTASLLAKYKNQVDSIKVIFKPVWTKYFPDSLDRIKIEEGK